MIGRTCQFPCPQSCMGQPGSDRSPHLDARLMHDQARLLHAGLDGILLAPLQLLPSIGTHISTAWLLDVQHRMPGHACLSIKAAAKDMPRTLLLSGRLRTTTRIFGSCTSSGIAVTAADCVCCCAAGSMLSSRSSTCIMRGPLSHVHCHKRGSHMCSPKYLPHACTPA